MTPKTPTPRLMACVNTVLDRADRIPGFVVAASLTLGVGIRFALLHSHAWGWAILGPGILLVAIKPFGTHLRNKWRLREAGRLLAEAREGNLTSMLGAMGKIDQVERSLGIHRED
jgi:hypothetical protein